jgi:hypothetical protein
MKKILQLQLLVLLMCLAFKANAQTKLTPANESWWVPKTGATSGGDGTNVVLDATGNGYTISKVGNNYYLSRRQTTGVTDTTWLFLGSTSNTFNVNAFSMPQFSRTIVYKPSNGNLYFVWKRTTRLLNFVPMDSVFVAQVSNLSTTPTLTKRWKEVDEVFSRYGNGPGGQEVQGIISINISPSENMYVIAKTRIHKISNTGVLTQTFCTPYTYYRTEVSDITWDNNDNIFVTRKRYQDGPLTNPNFAPVDPYITKINSIGIADTTWYKTTNDTLYREPIRISFLNGFVYASHIIGKPNADTLYCWKINSSNSTGQLINKMTYALTNSGRTTTTSAFSDSANNVYFAINSPYLIHRIDINDAVDSAWLSLEGPNVYTQGLPSVGGPGNQMYMGSRVLPTMINIPNPPFIDFTYSFYYSKLVASAFNVTISKQDASCVSTNNGWAKATSNGCIAGSYTYLWTPGNYTTDSIGGLAPGTYNVRVICGTDTVNKFVVIAAGTGPAAPIATNQTFCNSATIADLLATGTNIKWYASATGGSPLANSVSLSNGTKYYATQTVGLCESSTRAVDSVTIVGNVSNVNDTLFCNNATASINFTGATGNTYTWTSTQNGTGIAASGTGNINFTATNNTNTVKKDTVIVSASYNTPYSYTISDGTYAFADTTGSTYLNLTSEYSGANLLSTQKPIGFNFNFYGASFSNVYINRRGSISFTPNLSDQKIIFGQNRDQWIFDATTRIAYKTVGTAPNQKLVVSFINLKKPDNLSTTSQCGPFPSQTLTTTTSYTADPTAGYGVFQIILNETSNVIESAKQSVPSLTANTSSVSNGCAFPVGPSTTNPVNSNREGIVQGIQQGITMIPGRNNGDWLKLVNESKIFTPAAGFNCVGNKDTFLITVNPIPKVDSIPNQQACPGGVVAAINFTTPITGTTVGYKWVNNNTATGLAANGTGNIASFTASNTTGTSTVTVTPYILKTTTDTCFGAAKTFTLTIDLPAQPTTPSLVIYTGSKTLSQLNISGTNVQFYAANSGGTAIPTTTLVNDDSTYYVTQTQNGCESNRKQIIVNRIAADSIVVCSPATVAGLTTTPQRGDTARWFTTATGGTALDSTTSIPTGTYIYYVEEFSTVVSNRVPVTVIVNPEANVLPTADTTVCNGSTIPAINFATTTIGSTVTYNWTNSNTSIGLAASGTGNIASFVASNASTRVATTATIIVTPTITNAGITCEGVKDTFSITVNPTIGVRVIANQVVCNGSPTTAVSFTGGPRRSVATIVYNWTNNTPSIGLAASGTGTIPSVTAINNGNAPVIATITVTPTYTFNGVSCDGTPRTFTITVNPTATVDTIANKIVCNGANTTTINFSSPTIPIAIGSAIVYNWTNNNTNIGLATSGTDSIASFVATNTGTAPDTATITVTPTFTNAGRTCTGTARTFKIIVNPTAKVNSISNKVECNGSTVAAVTPSSPNTGGTVTYAWVNNNTAIGLAASGTGTIPSFTATNTGTSPITATVTITLTFTNGGVSCVGVDSSYTITINPPPVFNTIANQVACNGASTSVVAFSTALTGGTASFAWTNNNTAIGLAASGTGSLPSFTATNNTTAPISATITVVMTYTNAGLSCVSLSKTFTYTINPTANVSLTNDAVVCNGATVPAANFTTTAIPIAIGSTVTYAWTNNNTSIGLAASGTGNIASFTGVNTGTATATATVIVTPTFTNGGVSCTGVKDTFYITVNPTVTVNTISNQVVCNGSAVTAINFGTSASGGTTTYAWTNNTTSIGLAASGTGNIATFNAINTGTAPVTATITVTPTFTNDGVSCVGTAATFTITVNPTAIANAISNQVVCNGGAVTAVNFSTTAIPIAIGSTVVYNWTNNTTSIGLAASGTGNIATFNGINTGTAPVTATITVTPTFTNGGTSCVGTARTFTITINPTATVTTISNKVECNGSVVAAVTPTSPNTGGTVTFAWVNNNTAIGLAASGTGTIPSFTATNTGSSPITATVTITPTFTNGGVSCVGTDSSYTITINPPPVFDTIANQVACNGAAISVVAFTTSLTGGTAAFAWTNNNTAIGLAASGTGSLPSFTATNNTTAPISATITVVMTYTNAGLSCVSLSKTFTYTINPTANVSLTNDAVVCNGATVPAANFTTTTTGGTVTYTWTNNNTSIGLAASGSGNIASFTGVNTGTAPATATVIVTPTFTNAGVSCTGVKDTFYITVNPTVTLNTISNQVVCNSSAVTAINFGTSAIPIPIGSTTTYAWTNNTTSIGLAASGTGNIATFNAINTGTAPITATITVTPTFTNDGVSCVGTVATFTITVNPTAKVDTVSNQVVCNGGAVTAVNFGTTAIPIAIGSTVVYNWTNNTTSIGLAASGTGNIVTFNGINTGTAPVTATITVTPTFTNGGTSCVGTARTFTITVNPTATVTTISNKVECNGSVVASVTPTSPNTGGTVTYAWVNNNTAIGLAASGTGTIPSFTATNTGTAPVTATVTITPTFTNGGISCIGTSFSYTITVNPPPVFNAVANQFVCNGATTSVVPFTTALTGGTSAYAWTNSNTAIGLAASGTGNLPSFTATNNTTTPISGTITVVMTYTNAGLSCVSLPQTFIYTVNPTATVNAITSQVVCNGSPVTAINYGTTAIPIAIGSTVVYNWTNNTTSIGLAASGTGNIASFNGINTGTAPVTATITVTPTFTNGGTSCVGTPRTFTITVNPTVTVNAITNQVVCNGSAVTAINFGTSAIPIPIGSTTTYAWTNNTTSIGLAASGTGNIATFNAINTGTTPVTATITVTPTFTNGSVSCVGTPRTFTITVNPTTIITAQPVSSTICFGSSTAFTVATTGLNITYQWQVDYGTGFSNIAGATNATYVVAIPPTGGVNYNGSRYRCVVTGTCGTENSNTVTLTINPTPTVNISAAPLSFLQPFQTTNVLANVSPAGGSFKWYYNDVLVPSATGASFGTIGINNLGNYKFVYTDLNGCIATSFNQVIGGNTSQNLWVYPNPSKGQFNVRFYNQDGERFKVWIYTDIGKLVYKADLITGTTYSTTAINLSNQPSGTYVLKITNSLNKELVNKRILIVR